jgi:microsomal epoxide hydrolase
MAGLGYERYGAQGGDWGAMISCQLGLADPEHLVGIHLNMVVAPPPPDLDLDALQDDERVGLATYDHYARVDSGYAKIQGTKPQTIGYALDDSPAGLAGWIVEKFRAWSDCGGDLEQRFTKDQLLDNVMLYWLTGTAHSAGRLYYEAERTHSFVPGSRVEVPTGVAAFPAEIIRPARRWAELRFDLRHWTEMPRGGHFAAFEEPDLLVDDVRAFFRPLRVHGE